MLWIIAILLGALGYLLGSIPFGYLIAKAYGVDIRQCGSGNIGATNVLRIVGKTPGVAVFICDFLKGLLPVLAVLYILRQEKSATAVNIAALIGGCAILGHNYSVWLKFKGGKGISTSAGVFLGLMPLTLLGAVAVWGLVFYTTRYVSLASVWAALALPLIEFCLPIFGLTERKPLLLILAVLLSVMAVWRHRSNLLNIYHRREHRFQRKTDAENS